MQFSKLAALLPLVAAMPLEKRQSIALSQNDIIVLQLAHYLENLEFNLYTGGYENYTDADYTNAGFPAGFRDNVGLIAQQEATHRDTLASVLTAGGQTPLPACTYMFPYNSPGSFVALANMITTVGIGAYLGGAALLMDDATLLTEAASILTNEARHDAYLRAGAKGSPFPTPFDTTLPGLWAYNLAHQFVVSCPQELPNPPFVLLPKLSLTAPENSSAPPPANALQMPLANGTSLSFAWDPTTFFVSVDPNAPLYIAFINQNNPPVFEKITMTGTGAGTVALPDGLGNAVFAVLTTFSGGLNETQLAQFGTLAGPQEIVVS